MNLPKELLSDQLKEETLKILSNEIDLESMMNHKANVILEEIISLFSDEELLESDTLLVDHIVMTFQKHGITNNATFRSIEEIQCVSKSGVSTNHKPTKQAPDYLNKERKGKRYFV